MSCTTKCYAVTGDGKLTSNGTLIATIPIYPKTLGFLYFDNDTVWDDGQAANITHEWSVSVPHDALLNQTDNAITLWSIVRWMGTTADGGAKQTIISKGNATDVNYALQIDEATGTLQFRTANSEVEVLVSSEDTFPTNQDLFVAVCFTPGTTFNASNVQFYWGQLGGTIEKKTAVSTTWTSDTGEFIPNSLPLKIGALASEATANSYGYYYNGVIGPVGLFSTHKWTDDFACPTWSDISTWATDPDCVFMFNWSEMSLDGIGSTETDQTGRFTATHYTGNDIDGLTETSSGNIRRGFMYYEGTPPYVISAETGSATGVQEVGFTGHATISAGDGDHARFRYRVDGKDWKYTTWQDVVQMGSHDFTDFIKSGAGTVEYAIMVKKGNIEISGSTRTQHVEYDDRVLSTLNRDKAEVRHGQDVSLASPIIALSTNDHPTVDLGEKRAIDRFTYRYANIPVLDKPVTVTITTGVTNGVIYYTLNGKIPTVKSHKYTGPFTIDSNTTGGNIAQIRVKVFDSINGRVSSNNKSETVVARFRLAD